MSMLTIIQNVADTVGIDRPSSVVGSTSTTAKQMLALLNMSGKMLARRHTWQRLMGEHTFNTVSGTASYALPSDYDRHIDDTAWDRSNYWSVRGSITPQEWQIRKSAIVASGIRSRFRIKGNLVYIDPTPTAADSMVYEYIINTWTTDSAGANPSDKYNADADLTIFPEYLLELDLIWRFKKAKGLDYGEEFRDFETQFAIEKQADKPSYTLKMGSDNVRVLANIPDTGFG